MTDFDPAEDYAVDTDSWTGPHDDDPEAQSSPHGLEGCLSLHDSEGHITDLTPDGVTVTVTCPKCPDRTIWFTR